jgi:ribosomal protein S27E
MVKGNYYEPLTWTKSVNTSEPQAIDKSKPEQHELTKAQRKNKQRAENRRLRREGLLPPRRDANGFFDVKCEDCGDSYKSASGKTTICVECRPVLLASRSNIGCFSSSEPLASYAERYPSRVMILRNDVDLVKPLVFRQEKNVKLVGARHLARRFSVSWNTFASTILFASRGSSEWGLDHPICNLHEPVLRLIADFAGVQHKAAVAEWLEVKESEISVIQNNRKLAPGAAVE